MMNHISLNELISTTATQDNILQDNSVPGIRFYQEQSSGIRYPSITSVLGYFSNLKFQGWRDAVGEEEAKRVLRVSGHRGSILHGHMERLILDNDHDVEAVLKEEHSPLMKKNVRLLWNAMSQHVTEIYGVETKLISHELRVAGTCDLFCLWDGIPTVVDFKTSRKFKKRAYVDSYFLQVCSYAKMFRELLVRNDINRLKLLIFDDETENLSNYDSDVDTWEYVLKSTIDEWYTIHRHQTEIGEHKKL